MALDTQPIPDLKQSVLLAPQERVQLLSTFDPLPKKYYGPKLE